MDVRWYAYSDMYKEDIVHPQLIHPVQSYIFDLSSRQIEPQ